MDGSPSATSQTSQRAVLFEVAVQGFDAIAQAVFGMKFGCPLVQTAVAQAEFDLVILPFIVVLAVLLRRTMRFQRAFRADILKEDGVTFLLLVVETAFHGTFSGRTSRNTVELIKGAFFEADLIFFLARGGRWGTRTLDPYRVKVVL